MREFALRSTLVLALVAVVFAPGASSQSVPQLTKAPQLQNGRERIDKVDHAARMERIAITGDLGFPELPPVYWDSPRDDIQYIDRFPFGEQAASAADGATPEAKDGFIPSGANGTGTTIPEIFKYMVPAGYDPDEQDYQAGLPAIPLVMAYHGYGSSANSVALLSTIDDECYERGWAYFSPTGMDDQLFGSPLSQQNTEAALNWVLNHFNIDRDRIYLVGFSMGGGIVTNFAARHRDPDGTMFAAMGIVSGTFDWTMSWKLGNATVRTLLQSPFNFSGPPTNALYKFGYQKASGLYYDANVYPPLTQAMQPIANSSLATDLAPIPTYIVWDTGDTLVEVLKQEPQFYALVASLGGNVEFHTTSGTLHPLNGTPAPHSWAVLNEDALFDFFADKVVQRTPDAFHALMADSGQVSWMSLEQRATDNFSIVDGRLDTENTLVELSNVVNTTAVHLDMNILGLSGEPVSLAAGIGSSSFELSVTGFDEPPAYLVDATTGDLITGTESDPVADTLLHDVSSVDELDALVVTDPSWTTDLYTGPNPVLPGNPLTLNIDAPVTSSMALLFIGFTESLGTVPGGYHITLALGPPTLFVVLPLNPNGDANLVGQMPNNAALSGLTMLMQTVAINGSGGGVESVSNLWALHVQ